MSDLRSFRVQFGRALRRQCLICGERQIWISRWRLKETCPTCGFLFSRESGYSLGAIALNLIVAELFTMAIMIGLLVWSSWSWWQIEILILPLAIAFPLITFPYARCLWIALDLTFQPRNQR